MIYILFIVLLKSNRIIKISKENKKLMGKLRKVE